MKTKRKPRTNPKAEEHSCKRCKFIVKKLSRITGNNYYMCKNSEMMIRDSVYQTNPCQNFIAKKL